MPIEQIRVGQRVPGRNPDRDDVDLLMEEPNPTSWKRIELSMDRPPSGRLEIELLRPLTWIEAQQATIGSSIWLDLPELDAVGEATVHNIDACPSIPKGPGRVVTGTFAHPVSDNVLNVRLEGEDTPIGVTGQHLFWSQSREEFVPVSQLNRGEEVRTIRGDTLRVASVLPRPGPARVYNLEVQSEHVYHVSLHGILAHNCSTLAERINKTPAGQFGTKQQALRGTWSSKRGRSVFTPANTAENKAIIDLLATKGQTGVGYRMGKVNFEPFAEATVTTTRMTSSRTKNFRIADELYAKQKGITLEEATAFRVDNNLTWHELNDMKTMQLVPSEINRFFGHLGGVSEARKAGL